MNAAAIQYANLLLKEFGSGRGVKDAAFSATGTCTLNHPGGLSMFLELSEDGGTLHWYSPLCHTPTANREQYYARLLEWNLLGIATEGATLALDAPAGDVVLCYNQPVISLDASRFTDITENFLSTALRLHHELQS